MNGVMNGIVSDDRKYQQISRKSDEYSDKLAKMELPKEVRLLINRYVSEQNALGSRYGMLAYMLGFSDCKAMFLGKCLPAEVKNDHRIVTTKCRAERKGCTTAGFRQKWP